MFKTKYLPAQKVFSPLLYFSFYIFNFSFHSLHYSSHLSPKVAIIGYSEKLLHIENPQALLKSLSEYHL